MDLDATEDDLRELTPVQDLADDIRAAIDERVRLTPREAELRDAFVDVAAARLAQHLEHAHRASVATPRRLGMLETRLADVDAWRLRIAGVAERNGRLGKLDQEVAELRDDLDVAIADLRADLGTDEARRLERAELVALRADLGTAKERERERAVVSAIRWTTAKVLALLAAAGTIAGGGVWQTLRARAAIDAVEARRAGALDAHETAQDIDIARLFTLCTSRTQ